MDEAFEMDATKATLVKMVLLRKELVQLGDATSGGPGGGRPAPLARRFHSYSLAIGFAWDLMEVAYLAD